ncbi:helix-turn-helix transcriptional regulator [Streptomyces tsukubensis]|uniref:DNA-binding protein n=1 Tax=Streptomyces tsukubensis TaxID=83656 RepID=A0A1V4AAQ3_9ACTN|nr:helix-turn-helix transcriptional regulator [Streptomyces tsukubensis]OON80885.1 DNA-binding protein [Streptomyces tsukubensis]QFR93470.1 helix-turn-helix domain-containing protein [Streptomyces tsukubensis]
MTTTTVRKTPPNAGDGADEARRRELAGFLRSRRERITPEQVGLAPGGRRRTPGLRREEVAQLAAVGVTWYTWLEQARDIQVSAQVLDAVARTLLLDPHERAHLFSLAGSVDPAPGAGCPHITPALRTVLEQLEPLPACVQNSRYDILAHNRTYGRLLCDLDAVAPEDRNCLLLAYQNEEWQSSLVHLDDALRMMAAKFRASMAEHLAEPAWKTLLKRLQRSERFREMWELHEVVGSRSRTKHFRNREVGLVKLDHTDLWLGPVSGPRLVTYVPADAESAERIDRLHALAVAAREERAREERAAGAAGAAA